MNDDLGLFDDDEPRDVRPGRTRQQIRTRRRITWLGAGVIVAVLVLVAWFGVRTLLGIGGYSDYSGEGQGTVVIQVQEGQSQRAIASELVEKDVVKSARAFTNAGDGNSALLSIQPGYYKMRGKMSGEAAVKRITDPAARVGNLQIKPGSRLQDVHQPDGSTTEGVLTKLSEAACAKGGDSCVSAEELQRTASTADLTKLGVPEWAASKAAKVDPTHRLEGLILPGVYQIKPGGSANDLLKEVLNASAAQMSAAGLPSIAQSSGKDPYQILIIASLVQSEGIKKDFGKVARVVENRIQQNQKLELDSTVNYVLDRPEIRTSAADRAKAGPYNTYAKTGMPPSPIDSPGTDAIKAAAEPAQGDWLFFVKCEKDGSSCFAKTTEEHQRNVKSAQDRGVY